MKDRASDEGERGGFGGASGCVTFHRGSCFLEDAGGWNAERCGCGLLPDPRCEVPPVTAPGFPGDPSRNFGLFKSSAKGHYVN